MTIHPHGTRGHWGLTMADEMVRDLDPRERRILKQRMASDKPATLDALGLEYDVSRERIRQLEAGIRRKLRVYAWQDLCEESVGPAPWMRHIDQLESLLPAWFTAAEIGTAPEPDMPTVLELLKAAGAVQVTRGIWVTCGVEEGDDGDPSIPDDLGMDIATSLVSKSEAASRLAELGLDRQYLPIWIQDHGYVTRHGKVRRANETLEDFLAAELQELGRPAGKDRIQTWIDGRWAMGSAINLLQSNPRFARVDDDDYALTEWNLRGYSSIRDAIGDLLAEHGPLPLTEVVETLCAWFDVKPGSVESYAKGSPFRVRDGVVAFAGESTALGRGSVPTLKDITQERQRRHWFRTPHGYAFRIHVTEDHLRGSGWATSLMAAVVAGVAEGDEWSMSFLTCPGALKVTRHFHRQPNFGSIKPALEAHAAELGDVAFIEFTGESGSITRVDLRVVRAKDLPSDPFDRALLLASADPGAEDPFDAVQYALGLEASTFEEVLSVTKSRLDRALADVLEVWASL